MREVIVFAIGASFIGTVFFVSLVELLFTIRRRKVEEELREKVHSLKTAYNESLNKLTLEDEQKLSEAEKLASTTAAQTEEEKKHLEEDFQHKIADLEAHSEQALKAARERAKKLEKEAHQKAEDYLASRKKEVEEELMNLVVSVTKKVLPPGISYEAHKDLVIQALQEIQTSDRPL